MAESNLEVAVKVGVGIRLVPDDATAAWLESIGWKRPEKETSDDDTN